MNNITFEFYIGDSFEKTLIISNYSENIDEMYFTIKNNDGDKNYVLQKTLGNGITIVEDTIEEEKRKRVYDIFVDAADTEDFKVDTEYPFDIEIVTKKDETDLKRTIVKGIVTLNSATTRIWNEVVS